MTELYISTITKLNSLVEKGDISVFLPLDTAHFSSSHLTSYDGAQSILKSRPF